MGPTPSATFLWTSHRDPSLILADTSAWVEYDRGTSSPVDRRLLELIGNDGPLGVTEPVIMEVLIGARTPKKEEELRNLLARYPLLPFDIAADFDGAVHIYRKCRVAGITPRGMVDCMIASVAWRLRATLLMRDADLERVARVVGVAVDPASIGD